MAASTVVGKLPTIKTSSDFTHRWPAKLELLLLSSRDRLSYYYVFEILDSWLRVHPVAYRFAAFELAARSYRDGFGAGRRDAP